MEKPVFMVHSNTNQRKRKLFLILVSRSVFTHPLALGTTVACLGTLRNENGLRTARKQGPLQGRGFQGIRQRVFRHSRAPFARFIL